MATVRSNEVMNGRIDGILDSINEVIHCALENADHARMNDARGIARDDERIAAKLEKAYNMIRECRRAA